MTVEALLNERARLKRENEYLRLEMPPPDPLPTARVHGARSPRWPWLAVLAIVGCIAFSSLLQRIDSARVDAHRAWAATAVPRVELETVRATMHKPGAVDELCRRRTDALRSAVLALVRTGRVSMVGDPSWTWAEWPIAISSPTTRSTEARR